MYHFVNICVSSNLHQNIFDTENVKIEYFIIYMNNIIIKKFYILIALKEYDTTLKCIFSVNQFNVCRE
jgi:uncharacterized protein YehS (DUF1456 family)